MIAKLYHELHLPLSCSIEEVIKQARSTSNEYVELLARYSENLQHEIRTQLLSYLLSTLFGVAQPNVTWDRGFGMRQDVWTIALGDWLKTFQDQLKAGISDQLQAAFDQSSLKADIQLKSIRLTLLRIIQSAQTAIKPASHHKAMNVLKQKGTLASLGGWSEHFVGAVIQQNAGHTRIARCNRGEGATLNGVHIKQIKPNSVSAVVERVLPLDYWSKEYFLEGIQHDLTEEEETVLPMSRQVRGTCAASSWRGILRAITFFVVEDVLPELTKSEKVRYTKEIADLCSQGIYDIALQQYLAHLSINDSIHHNDAVFLARLRVKEEHSSRYTTPAKKLNKTSRKRTIDEWMDWDADSIHERWERTINEERPEILLELTRGQLVRHESCAPLIHSLSTAETSSFLDWLIKYECWEILDEVLATLTPKQTAKLLLEKTIQIRAWSRAYLAGVKNASSIVEQLLARQVKIDLSRLILADIAQQALKCKNHTLMDLLIDRGVLYYLPKQKLSALTSLKVEQYQNEFNVATSLQSACAKDEDLSKFPVTEFLRFYTAQIGTNAQDGQRRFKAFLPKLTAMINSDYDYWSSKALIFTLQANVHEEVEESFRNLIMSQLSSDLLSESLEYAKEYGFTQLAKHIAWFI